MKSLSIKYRPKTFEDVTEQSVTIDILKAAVENKTFKHAYLFAGKSGCGKTTIARIFANAINENEGSPIEIDGASNNGVDNVEAIVSTANQTYVLAKYKIYIIDECHMLTTAAWNAFLKGIEEPAETTIYIFCTTEPEKVPLTVRNRVQEYRITPISNEGIKNRLLKICANEGFTNYEQGCDLISKLAHGGMRDAITYLEQCAGYSTDLSVENIKTVLGDSSYETMLRLTNTLVDRNEAKALEIIENIYNSGKDLKNFINSYFDFVLDANKYILFKNINLTNIPSYLMETTDKEININYTVGIENPLSWYNRLVDRVLEIKLAIKNDPTYKTTIEAYLMKTCRGM